MRVVVPRRGRVRGGAEPALRLHPVWRGAGGGRAGGVLGGRRRGRLPVARHGLWAARTSFGIQVNPKSPASCVRTGGKIPVRDKIHSIEERKSRTGGHSQTHTTNTHAFTSDTSHSDKVFLTLACPTDALRGDEDLP